MAEGVAGTIIQKFKGLPNTIKALAVAGGIGVGLYVFIEAYKYLKGYLGTGASTTSGYAPLDTSSNYGGYSGYSGGTQGTSPVAATNPIQYTSPSSYPSSYGSVAGTTSGTTPTGFTTNDQSGILSQLESWFKSYYPTGPGQHTTTPTATTPPTASPGFQPTLTQTLTAIAGGALGAGFLAYASGLLGTVGDTITSFFGGGLPVFSNSVPSILPPSAFSNVGPINQSIGQALGFGNSTPAQTLGIPGPNLSGGIMPSMQQVSQGVSSLVTPASALVSHVVYNTPIISGQAPGGFTPQFSTPQTNPIQWLPPAPTNQVTSSSSFPTYHAPSAPASIHAM